MGQRHPLVDDYHASVGFLKEYRVFARGTA